MVSFIVDSIHSNGIAMLLDAHNRDIKLSKSIHCTFLRNETSYPLSLNSLPPPLQIPGSVLSQLEAAGSSQRLHPFSPRAWPVRGGRRLHAATSSTSATSASSSGFDSAGQLLLTGHEDGSVSMWAVGCAGGSGGMRRLYTLHTSSLFVGEFPPAQEPGQYEHEETWPPFRRTGVFDPYSDDPRLAVKQLELQVVPPRRYDGEPSASLAIGGAAGECERKRRKWFTGHALLFNLLLGHLAVRRIY